jgi:hypothetical protein
LGDRIGIGGIGTGDDGACLSALQPRRLRALCKAKQSSVCNAGIEQARGDTGRMVERRKDRARDLALDQREEVPLRRPAYAAEDRRRS